MPEVPGVSTILLWLKMNTPIGMTMRAKIVSSPGPSIPAASTRESCTMESMDFFIR